MAAMALIALPLVVMAIASQASAAGGINVSHQVGNDWGSGYQAAVKVRNDSSQTIRNWRFDFSLPHRITSLWNAKLVSQQGTAVKVVAPDWDPDLSPGETVEIGYVAQVSGSRVAPSGCSFSGAACTFGGESPAPTPTPTPTPPPTPAPAPSGGTVSFKTTDSWSGGFNGAITIANPGPTAVSGWNLQFSFPGVTIKNLWNGVLSSSAGVSTVRNESWNGAIPAGGSVSFGFTADGSPGSGPGGCMLNGNACRFGGATPTPAPTPTPNPTPTPAPVPGPDPVLRTPLTTSGAKIVGSDGKELIIQGVNWFGFETSNHVVHGLWARDYTSMLKQIHDLGFNALRIPFSIQALRSNSISSVNYSLGANSRLQGKTPLQALDLIIEEARRQGLLVILDNHSGADDSNQIPLWYDETYSEADWTSTWKMLAQRYADDPNVVGADLNNEPHGEATYGGGGPTDWRLAAQRAANAIAPIAPHWLMIVEGTESGVSCQQLEGHWWGGNLEGERCHPLTIDRQKQLVFSPHEYGPGVWNQAWFDRPDFRQELLRRWQVGFDFISKRADDPSPILVGEFGGKQTGTNTVEGIWQRQFMDFLANRRHSWTYWSWNPNSSDTGGILNDDWKTVNTEKVALLQRLQRLETSTASPARAKTHEPKKHKKGNGRSKGKRRGSSAGRISRG